MIINFVIFKAPEEEISTGQIILLLSPLVRYYLTLRCVYLSEVVGNKNGKKEEGQIG